MRVRSLELTLPEGWVQLTNDLALVELRPLADGSKGMLQVVQLPEDQFTFITTQGSLGQFAATLGETMGQGSRSWGKAAGHQEGACAMGRFGLAQFSHGPVPSLVLWVTVSDTAAYLWTWLGPSPMADELKQALSIVIGAEHLTARA